jgi:receptor protein-tyrosine kinase
VLVGRAGSEAIVRIGALRNLYILPAGPPPPNPQELLGRSVFVRQLRTLESLFDVVLADTTAAEMAADGQIAAAASGSALLVVRQDATDLERLRALRATLDLTGSQVLGAVVNRL